MKISVNEDYSLTVDEVYSGCGIRCDDGEFGFCQRDGGIELMLPDGPDGRAPYLGIEYKGATVYFTEEMWGAMLQLQKKAAAEWAAYVEANPEPFKTAVAAEPAEVSE